MFKENTKHVPGTNDNELGHGAAAWITKFNANVRGRLNVSYPHVFLNFDNIYTQVAKTNTLFTQGQNVEHLFITSMNLGRSAIVF